MKRTNLLKFLAAVLLLFSMDNSHAILKAVNTSLSSTIRTNRYAWGSFDHNASIDFNPVFIAQLKNSYTAVLSGTIGKSWNNDSSFEWKKDLAVVLSKNWTLGKRLTLDTSLIGIIPMTKRSKDIAKLNSSGIFGNTANFKLSNKAQLAYDLSFIKNFHGLKVAYDDVSNESIQIDSSLELTYQFFPKLSADINVGRAYGWTYYGNQLDSIYHTQELNYQATKQLTLSIAHQRGGDYFKEDGRTTNFDLYKDEDSIFYFRAKATF